MKWSMDMSWDVHSTCPFEGARRDTVLAANEAEARTVWSRDYGYGTNVVVKYPEAQAVIYTAAENPDFGRFLTGYKLISINQCLLTFGNVSVTTWTRRAVRREHNPNRDTSWQEAVTIVPREIAEKYGAEGVAMKMMADERPWQKDAAMAGKTTCVNVDAETVRVTLTWYLDLS